MVERLLQWLPYLLEHLDGFINRFHTQTVSLGQCTVGKGLKLSVMRHDLNVK